MSLDFFGERRSSVSVSDEFFEVHAANIAKRYPDCNSVLLRDLGCHIADHSGMGKSASEIRRENFASEVAKLGGPAKFEELYGVNADYIRQLINGAGKSSGRNMGAKAARKMEGILKKPPNWMDHDHSDPRTDPQVQDQTDRSIDELSYAVSALVVTTIRVRPAAAKVFSDQLRSSNIPQDFLDSGLLKELLNAVEKGLKKAKSRRV